MAFGETLRMRAIRPAEPRYVHVSKEYATDATGKATGIWKTYKSYVRPAARARSPIGSRPRWHKDIKRLVRFVKTVSR